MDTSQYLDIFLDESKEHLQNLSDQIMDLEQNPENMDTINEIFRAAHSLKGMAGTMGYKRMQTLTHDMENVFSEVRNGTFKVRPGMIDILFKSLDALEEYVNNIQQTTEEGTNDNQDLIDALNSILKIMVRLFLVRVLLLQRQRMLRLLRRMRGQTPSGKNGRMSRLLIRSGC